jgi:hypothetical protein
MYLQLQQACFKHDKRAFYINVEAQRQEGSQSCISACMSALCCKTSTFSKKAKKFELKELKDLSGQKQKERHYSCRIDDWVEAVGVVVKEMEVNPPDHVKKSMSKDQE